jgi:hypothetical protein
MSKEKQRHKSAEDQVLRKMLNTRPEPHKEINKTVKGKKAKPTR